MWTKNDIHIKVYEYYLHFFLKVRPNSDASRKFQRTAELEISKQYVQSKPTHSQKIKSSQSFDNRKSLTAYPE